MIPEPNLIRPQIKCLFVGLDNGGKTSLLLMLEMKFLQVLKTKPTKHIVVSDFHILGIPIKIWDMGGQKEYRMEYLSKPHYFGETKLLFYVIDIQDEARIEVSLKYFEDIVNNFAFLEITPKIIILLHKSDPDLKDSMHLNKNIYKVKQFLSNNPNTKDITIYRTSIYFPEEFHHIFIQAIFEIIPEGYRIRELLTQFMEDLQAEAVLIIDENLLIIAEAYSSRKSLAICRVCGKNLAKMTQEFYEMNLVIPDRIGIEIDGLIFFKHVPYSQTHFYLIFFTIMQEHLRNLSQYLPKLLEDLSNVLSSAI